MDKKEELKRQNYFDYKRDEFMAMDEYLQSSISEIDLQKMNEGGMMSMENMTAPLGMQEGGDPIQERMAMLRESMRDDENQSMRAPDITSVALQIAKQQGDSSEDNINLIINQLQALMPSLKKTMQKELTPMSTQGLKYLFDKMNVMTGISSDPQLNRNVGFGRVE